MGRKARCMALVALLCAGNTGTTFAVSEESMRAMEDAIATASFTQQQKELLRLRAHEAADAGDMYEDIRVIVTGAVDRGMDAAVLQHLLEQVRDTARSGLPPAPVANAIEQGIAKGVASDRILVGAERVGMQLRNAAAMVQRTERGGVLADQPAVRLRVTEQVAIALRNGIQDDDLAELARVAARNKAMLDQYGRAVEFAATIKELGLRGEQAMIMARQGLQLGYSGQRYAQMEHQLIEYRRRGMSGDESFREMNRFMERALRSGGPTALPGGGRGPGPTPGSNGNMRKDRR